jgi:Tfp pilus assembly protein PilV
MRSTDRAGGQRGASLIEAVVASALMGIGVVGGLTAWDTAAISANKAVRIAWANCIVRSEMDAVLSEEYVDGTGLYVYGVPGAFAVDGTVEVDVSRWRGGAEQAITVRAYDPASNHTAVLAQVSALKAAATTGAKPLDDPVSDVGQGCPKR